MTKAKYSPGLIKVNVIKVERWRSWNTHNVVINCVCKSLDSYFMISIFKKYFVFSRSIFFSARLRPLTSFDYLKIIWRGCQQFISLFTIGWNNDDVCLMYSFVGPANAIHELAFVLRLWFRKVHILLNLSSVLSIFDSHFTMTIFCNTPSCN